MRVREEMIIRRLKEKLYCIRDNKFIPDLKCNGTILKILKELVKIQPHDYGKAITKNLCIGSGISIFIQWTLYQSEIYFRDKVILNTKDQRADIFTKGLKIYSFEQVRKQVMG